MPLGQRFDHLVLALQHRRQIEPQTVDRDAVVGELVARLLVVVRGLQQRLRRDAADVEAGAAEGRPLLDAGGLQAELGGTDRRDVAAGPPPMITRS